MSFILDALRKSEAERRNAAAPTLAAVPVEVPRAQVPGWMWAIIAVLGAAVIGLGTAWWSADRGARDAGGFVAAPGNAVSTSALAEGPAGAGVTTPSTGTVQPGATSPSATAPAPLTGAQFGGAAATADSTRDSIADPATVSPGLQTAPAGAGAAAAVVDATPEPALPPASSSATRTAASRTLPTREELTAAGIDLPPLNLELHVYAAEPSRRWVYIDGNRYTEGRRTAAGPLLVEILPEGIALNHDGRDFLLLAQ